MRCNEMKVNERKNERCIYRYFFFLYASGWMLSGSKTNQYTCTSHKYMHGTIGQPKSSNQNVNRYDMGEKKRERKKDSDWKCTKLITYKSKNPSGKDCVQWAIDGPTHSINVKTHTFILIHKDSGRDRDGNKTK